MNRSLPAALCAIPLLASMSLTSSAQVQTKYFNCTFNVKFDDNTSLSNSTVFFNGDELFTYDINSSNGTIPAFSYSPANSSWYFVTGSYHWYPIVNPKPDPKNIRGEHTFFFYISNQGPHAGPNRIQGEEAFQTNKYRAISPDSSLNCLPFDTLPPK